MERLKKDLIGEGFYQETGGPGSIKKKVVSKKEVLTRWVLSHVNVVSAAMIMKEAAVIIVTTSTTTLVYLLISELNCQSICVSIFPHSVFSNVM